MVPCCGRSNGSVMGLIHGLGSSRDMKVYAKTIAVMVLTGSLAACGDTGGNTPVADAQATTAKDTSKNTVTAVETADLQPLAANAPAFASLYPGATLLQPPVTANGVDGPGGIAEFTTSASPEQVIEHYRALADTNGLDPVMAMNQGTARAFAALNAKGAEVQVVASPGEQDQTSVHLTWKSGQ